MGEWRISPYVMLRAHGRGPKGKTCGDCVHLGSLDIFFGKDEEFMEPTSLGTCMKANAVGGRLFFAVYRNWDACGLFRSQWQYERELLESQGQIRMDAAFPVHCSLFTAHCFTLRRCQQEFPVSFRPQQG